MVSQLTFEVAAMSDVGTKRKSNEDCFAVSHELGLYVVSDGMGGAVAGDVASKMAVEYLMQRLKGAEFDSDFRFDTSKPVSEQGQRLVSALMDANRFVYASALGTERFGMGCTAAVVLITGNLASVAHVGDSRVYRIRNGALDQLTNDHSLVAELLKKGLLSPESAEHSPHSNIITRALGPMKDVEPEVTEFSLIANDMVLLATDGLTKSVGHEHILQIASSGKSLQELCHDLIETAKLYGSEDNITCVLLQAKDQIANT
jgi:serine/threonine protein phosphatase PrpC